MGKAAFGDKLSSMTAGKHFVVDTSRNGLGPTPMASGAIPPGARSGRRH